MNARTRNVITVEEFDDMMNAAFGTTFAGTDKSNID